ncbi:hypothetical protein H4W33_009629 [Kibdelosporangium phytohabitans]|nr:hypothetical protein [Kibdelosporangium phytohabitans]
MIKVHLRVTEVVGARHGTPAVPLWTARTMLGAKVCRT